MHPARIAMIPTGSYGAVGGPTTYITAIAGEMRKAGCQVEVLQWSQGNRERPVRGRWGSTRRLFSLLRRSCPDVIHIHSNYRFILPAVLHRAIHPGRTRVVFTFHTAPTFRTYLPCSSPPRREFTRTRRLLATFLLRMCDKITSVSESIVRELNRGYRLNIREFATIPSGGQPQSVDWAALRSFVERYCLADRFPIVGTMGVMQWDWKVLGQQRCIEAIGLLRSRLPKIMLLIAGDGPYRPYLEDLAQRLDLREHVTFVGNIDQVPVFLEALDLYAHMAEVEGCPVSVVEALWAGKAVVVANRGGIPEIIINGVTGSIVEPSAEHLAKELHDLARNPGRRRELGRRGHEYARRHLSWANIAKRYLDVYQG